MLSEIEERAKHFQLPAHVQTDRSFCNTVSLSLLSDGLEIQNWSYHNDAGVGFSISM